MVALVAVYDGARFPGREQLVRTGFAGPGFGGVAELLGVLEEVLVLQLHDAPPLHVELELLHLHDLDQLALLQRIQVLDPAQPPQLLFRVIRLGRHLSVVVFLIRPELIVVSDILRVFQRLGESAEDRALSGGRPEKLLQLLGLLSEGALGLGFGLLDLLGVNLVFLANAFLQLPGDFLLLRNLLLAVTDYFVQGPGVVDDHRIPTVGVLGGVAARSVLGMCLRDSHDLSGVAWLRAHHLLIDAFGAKSLLYYEIPNFLFLAIQLKVSRHLLPLANCLERKTRIDMDLR